MSRRRLRCAIYTRKSTEEGLEQEFNSLDAQREACEAYIASQKHEGWIGVAGPAMMTAAISGGTMERPALQRLLADIAAGKIDVVVVYKVDRLTRVARRFCQDRRDLRRAGRVVRLGDPGVQHHHVDGAADAERAAVLRPVRARGHRRAHPRQDRRLEEEGHVDGRLRAARLSRQRPDARHRGSRGEIVRTIFAIYLELGTVRRVEAELTQRDFALPGRNARWTANGAKPFSRGQIYKLLSNPIYSGEIGHKGNATRASIQRSSGGNVRPGCVRLASQRSRTQGRPHAKEPSLLAGLIRDAAGHKLVATHATKQGKRYRYYISRALHEGRQRGRLGRDQLTKAEALGGTVWRLPAVHIEAIVVREISGLLMQRAASSRSSNRSSRTGCGRCRIEPNWL